jgi:DNA-binding response OmpR family regulator
VVTVDDLVDVGWPGAPPRSRDAVHAAVGRLRRRVVALGLIIRTVRGCGFVVDADPTA